MSDGMSVGVKDAKKVAIKAIKAWQLNFYRGVFNPTPEHIKQACLDIEETEELPARERLTIYRNSILGGISSGLMGVYPVCTRLVGDTFFTHMIAGYLKQYPSGSADMGDYGEFLADYLEVFLVKINQQQDLKYLPDVARLEWLWHQAFNALEMSLDAAGILPLTELANVSAEQQGSIRFKVQPSLGLITSNYPIDQIWQANQLNDSRQENSQQENDEAEIALDEEVREFVIWRSSDFAMNIERITIAGGLAFLNDIQRGYSFAEIAAQEYSSPVEELLPHFLQSGLIVGFELVL
jgi:hypothetical protein